MRARLELACLFSISVAMSGVGCAPRQEAREPHTPAFDAPAGSAPVTESQPPASAVAAGEPDQVGLASWYGAAFAGRKTSNGERFDPKLFTAAHKKLPFGTWVEVRRIDNGRTVRVRINDRGPNGRAAHRIIDLSQRAAAELDMLRAGVVEVEVRVLRGP
jgi:rare lipoprotein A